MQAGLTRRRATLLKDMGIDIWLSRDDDDETDSLAADPVGRTNDHSNDDAWEALQAKVAGCQRCNLAATRTNTVFGSGNPHAELMLVGEAPGAEEDRLGQPFVGRAGKLLDAMLFSIGMDRQQVFICNVLKCRPPGNHDPQPEQVEACAPYLDAQIRMVAPRIILALGRFAAHRLLKTDDPVWRMREADNRLPGADIPVIVTYHPASLLRNPEYKSRAWQDLCRVRSKLD